MRKIRRKFVNKVKRKVKRVVKRTIGVFIKNKVKSGFLVFGLMMVRDLLL